MALISCPECGKEASDMAEKCPNCGYPFSLLKEAAVEEEANIENDKKEEKHTKVKERKWVVPVAIIAAIVILAVLATLILFRVLDTMDPMLADALGIELPATKAPQKSTTTASVSVTGEESIDGDLQNTIDTVTAEYEALAADITDYASYKKNIQRVADWYLLCEEQSGKFYAQLGKDTYCRYCDITEGGLDDYGEWNGAISDVYDAWNDAMQDYYEAWNDLYQDAYTLLNKVISGGFAGGNYNEVYDAWDKMYDLHSDAWENMYDLYSDGWDDLYDLYSDVYDEFYDGNADIEAVYNKIYNKA